MEEKDTIECSRCKELAASCTCDVFLECNACGQEYDAVGAEIYAGEAPCPACHLTLDQQL